MLVLSIDIQCYRLFLLLLTYFIERPDGATDVGCVTKNFHLVGMHASIWRGGVYRHVIVTVCISVRERYRPSERSLAFRS